MKATDIQITVSFHFTPETFPEFGEQDQIANGLDKGIDCKDKGSHGNVIDGKAIITIVAFVLFFINVEKN